MPQRERGRARRRKACRTQFQGPWAPEDRTYLPWDWSRREEGSSGMGLGSGEGRAASPVAVSFRTGHVKGWPQCQERGSGPGLLASPCPQAVRLDGSARRESSQEAGPQVALLPLKSPTGKCFTWVGHWAASWKNLMSLHSTPSMDTGGKREVGGDGAAEAISLSLGEDHQNHHTSQHSLLLLGGADEAADALDDLALRIYFLFPGFLAQEDGGNCKASRNYLCCSHGKQPSLSSPTQCFLLPGVRGGNWQKACPPPYLPGSGRRSGSARHIFI